MTKELTCIRCPLGCQLTADIEGGKVLSVSGNTCPRGEEYAQKELLHPTRILTSTIRIKNGEIPMISVKTKEDIPKDKMMECMEAIKTLSVEAPIKTGDILLNNAAGTGVPIVATKSVSKINPT